MNSITKKAKFLAPLAMIAMLGACKPDLTDYSGNYQGYDYAIQVSKNQRKFSLSKPYENFRGKTSYGIYAEDWTNDGRFDMISFFGLPKDHPLEEYVNLKKLEDAYQSIINANRNH